MKSFSFPVLVVALVAVDQVQAFGGSFAGSKLSNSVANNAAMNMEYIPNGMSKEQWKKIKDADKKKGGKNLGKTGITTFQSRSFSDWQKAGGINLFPVDPKTVKNKKDLPYMQRAGGSADDADLKKKKNSFGNMFSKKKAPEPEPEPEKKNWWSM